MMEEGAAPRQESNYHSNPKTAKALEWQEKTKPWGDKCLFHVSDIRLESWTQAGISPQINKNTIHKLEQIRFSEPKPAPS